MSGNVVDACTSATMLAESVIEVIIQAAPTPWIRPAEVRHQAGQPQGSEGLNTQRRQGRRALAVWITHRT